MQIRSNGAMVARWFSAPKVAGSSPVLIVIFTGRTFGTAQAGVWRGEYIFLIAVLS